MRKFIENFWFGLAFGMGFCIAWGVWQLIVWLLNRLVSGAAPLQPLH